MLNCINIIGGLELTYQDSEEWISNLEGIEVNRNGSVSINWWKLEITSVFGWIEDKSLSISASDTLIVTWTETFAAVLVALRAAPTVFISRN